MPSTLVKGEIKPSTLVKGEIKPSTLRQGDIKYSSCVTKGIAKLGFHSIYSSQPYYTEIYTFYLSIYPAIYLYIQLSMYNISNITSIPFTLHNHITQRYIPSIYPAIYLAIYV